MKDKISTERIKKLHVSMQKRVTAFMDAIEALGMTPRISSGLRTIDEQNALYAKGRTIKGAIVTNARGGESWHNYGLAIDLCFIKPDGDIDFNVPDRVGKIAKEFKLEWGATWAFEDRPHFQLEKLPQNPKSWGNDKIENHAQKYVEVREPVVSSWATVSVEKAKQKGIINNWSAPQEAVSDETYQWVFYKLGVLNRVTTQALTREQFAVILDRLKLLD
jgi:peptidoglycan L-alanyl-D-glutamate endopeptidase CwlK